MKHRTMSHLAAVLMTVCLVLSLFGCAPNTDDSHSASDPAAASATQTPEASSDGVAQEPALSSDSQPAAEEDKAEPTAEEKQAVTEKAKEQLADIQSQSEQMEADSAAEVNSEVQASLNEAVDTLDSYLQEQTESK